MKNEKHTKSKQNSQADNDYTDYLYDEYFACIETDSDVFYRLSYLQEMLDDGDDWDGCEDSYDRDNWEVAPKPQIQTQTNRTSKTYEDLSSEGVSNWTQKNRELVYILRLFNAICSN